MANGLRLPGQTVYYERRRDQTATVLADGTLRLADGVRASIHKAGALMSGRPACNGWEHWYFEDGAGELRVIDELREQVRKGEV